MPATLTSVGYANTSRLDNTMATSPPAGWVGSATGTPGDFVIMSSGVVNPAAATGATVATAEVGILNNPIASTVAAGGGAPSVEKITDQTLIELPIATSSGGTLGVPVTSGLTLSTIIGNQYGVSRSTSNGYYVNTNVAGAANTLTMELVDISQRCPATDAFPYGLFKLVRSAYNIGGMA